MIIGSRQRLVKTKTDPRIPTAGANIKQVICEQLSRKNQISKIIAKVTKDIGVLRRTKAFVPKSTLITICKSLILPHFDHCLG